MNILMDIAPLCGIYAITTPRADLVAAVAAALRGGVGAVQYRDKGDDHGRRSTEAGQLRELCERFGALFIVNDDVELAAQAGAHGVHIGKDDGSLAQAREQLGERAVIGVSCYNQIERARQAAAAGADYVAFGSVFISATKPQAVRAPLELLGQARAEMQLPVVAIGGIGHANIAEVAAAGADAAAVVRAIFAAPDIGEIESAAARLCAGWRQGSPGYGGDC